MNTSITEKKNAANDCTGSLDNNVIKQLSMKPASMDHGFQQSCNDDIILHRMFNTMQYPTLETF